ncbi:MAG: T9SS type A sorting domain-containing protein, partial [bacterium]
DHLTEWWTNTEKGLEQWFTIAHAPEGRAAGQPLRMRMALATDMQVSLQAANRLTLQKGNTTLHSDKLQVWDATGKTLSAELSFNPPLGGRGANIELHIADAGATYPLTIDPTWTQQAYLKASNTEAVDQFGYSVAISGETIVVGAIGEASNATGVNGNQANNSANAAGAAYVFVRSGVVWTQQAYLKASNTGASDVFGYSVAISGETIVVGAVTEDSNATGVNGNAADNSAFNAGAATVFTLDLALPVEDLRLTGEWTSEWTSDSRGDAQLSWQVSREALTLGYELERSANLTDWQVVTFRSASANNGQGAGYSHLDAQVPTNTQGQVYYRVRQQDLNGAQQYSNTVVLSRSDRKSRPGQVGVYPNPVATPGVITLEVPEGTGYTFRLQDALGRTVHTQVLPQDTYTVPLAQLPAGVYLFTVESGTFRQVGRLVVQ